MFHTTCLVVNVGSVSGRSQHIGSLSGHIDLARLPCFGKLPIDKAHLPCFVNVPAASTHYCESLFLKTLMH
jgi:hypothetical protein